MSSVRHTAGIPRAECEWQGACGLQVHGSDWAVAPGLIIARILTLRDHLAMEELTMEGGPA